jgi:hypothetical protein
VVELARGNSGRAPLWARLRLGSRSWLRAVLHELVGWLARAQDHSALQMAVLRATTV